MAAGNVPLTSIDAFLDAEELADTRHRCHDGVVSEMEERSLEHAVPRSKFRCELHAALRGRGYGVVGRT